MLHSAVEYPAHKAFVIFGVPGRIERLLRVFIDFSLLHGVCLASKSCQVERRLMFYQTLSQTLEKQLIGLKKTHEMMKGGRLSKRT